MSSCMSCVACQRCNTCQLECETCQNSCDTRQNYCKTNQLVSSHGGFSFGQELTSTKRFLSHSNWNKIVTYIKTAYEKGQYNPPALNTYPSNTITSWEVKQDDIMTAALFNNIASAMELLGSTASISLDNNGKSRVYGVGSTYKPEGDIVYGTYFQKLENYANSFFKYHYDQCSLCNVNCDNGCDKCMGCNACESCYVGNSSPCCSSCNTHSDE